MSRAPSWFNKTPWPEVYQHLDKFQECHLPDVSLVNGYPVIRVQGKIVYLALHVWIQTRGTPPKGQISRSCGSKRCINPLHLQDSQTAQTDQTTPPLMAHEEVRTEEVEIEGLEDLIEYIMGKTTAPTTFEQLLELIEVETLEPPPHATVVIICQRLAPELIRDIPLP